MDNSSDDEWRKKGVEFKIIDEGEKKKRTHWDLKFLRSSMKVRSNCLATVKSIAHSVHTLQKG